MRPQYYPYIITLVAVLLFIPFLGAVHLFDWDEINFAEIAREMYVRQDFIQVTIDYKPFWEKPPLFFWLQAACMGVFGVNEFAARLPNAICGIITLPLLYGIGKQLHSIRFGLIWVLCYAGSLLPFFYFKSGIIDPYFNLFIYLSYYCLYQTVIARKEPAPQRSWLWLSLAGISACLALLTKGPVAYLLISLSLFVYWVMQKFRFFISPLQWVYFTVWAFSGFLVWFSQLSQSESWLMDFINYQIRLFSTQDAGHGGFFGYHFVVVLIGCFPASIFAIAALRAYKKLSSALHFTFYQWNIILLFTVLVVFSVVQSKIVHYSSLCYFPLTYLAACYVVEMKAAWSKSIRWSIAAAGLLLAFVFGLLPFVGQNIHWLRPLLQKDPFALANLDAQVNWYYIESLVGIIWASLILVSIYFEKRGKINQSLGVLFGSTMITLWVVLALFVPKIERYSQAAAVDFCKSLAGQDVYVRPLFYKSYVHYFYTQYAPPTHPNYYQYEAQTGKPLEHWLRYGAVDKPVYFITKIHRAQELATDTGLVEVMNRNGFVAFKRKHLAERAGY